MRAPPLLPLTAIAIGGVLSLAALRGLEATPAMLNAITARAEGVPATQSRAAQSSKATGARAAAPASATPLPEGTAQPAPTTAAATAPQNASSSTPVCAASPAELAKQAGLSPGELQALQNLSSRRGQLDDRERALDTQLQLLAAADTKIDGKLKALTALKAEIQGLLGLGDGKAQAEIDRLVIVYSKMKPKDAGAIMAQLDDKVRIPVAAKMKEKDLAAILSQMPTAEAKKITETLAARYNTVRQVAESLQNPPPEPPAAAVAPTKAPARKARRVAKSD
jgi:flagellar motility protein MotE (MotC chaperone)